MLGACEAGLACVVDFCNHEQMPLAMCCPSDSCEACTSRVFVLGLPCDLIPKVVPVYDLHGKVTREIRQPEPWSCDGYRAYSLGRVLRDCAVCEGTHKQQGQRQRSQPHHSGEEVQPGITDLRPMESMRSAVKVMQVAGQLDPNTIRWQGLHLLKKLCTWYDVKLACIVTTSLQLQPR